MVSMSGKSTSELCIVTTPPSFQGLILELLEAFPRASFPVWSYTKAPWLLAKILRGSQVLWAQWVGLVNERPLPNLMELKYFHEADQGLHLSACISALQQLQGQHQAGKETTEIIPVPDTD